MQNTLPRKILEIEDIKQIKPNFDVLKILSKDVAMQVQTVIFDIDKKTLFVLTTNYNPQLFYITFQKIQEKGYKLDIYYTDNDALQEALKWYDILEEKEKQIKQELETRKNVTGLDAISMIKKLYQEREKYDEQFFLSELIRLSFQSGASDLHFQSEENLMTVRLRRDGILTKILEFTHDDFKKYLIKLKFMSGVRLNIDYKPQDGRFSFDVDIAGEKKTIDVRVNFMPGIGNENIVMRFLDATKSIKTFTEIGFMDESFEILKRNLEKKSGIILVTGPTGSGKTTTLYSILNYLNDSTKKIITLEDPVEYQLSGIQQSQINEKKEYTYEEGLKAILRQDPDIIMVGEIRTLETAEIAINAALTGHLVLSTLHTNSAIETISRLLNMGIKQYMLAPALNLIIGQRLVRRLHDCKSYRVANQAEEQEIKDFIKKIKTFNPKKKIEFNGQVPNPTGCNICYNDGFLGRIAAIETFEVNDDIKNVILSGKSTFDVYSEARQQGFITLKEDAYLKMLKGYTTLDEIRRAI